MAKNGDGEYAFFICQIRHFAIGPPPPPPLAKIDKLFVIHINGLNLFNYLEFAIKVAAAAIITVEHTEFFTISFIFISLIIFCASKHSS